MRIKTFGLTLVALLAVGAPSALGAEMGSWKLNGAELTEKFSVTAKGTIEIEEQHFGNRYSCSFNQEGTVGPGTVGQITGKKVFTCSHISGAPCESAIELEALHLPWKTELVTVNHALRDEIKNSGSGTPEWLIKCNGPAGKYEIHCGGAETSTGIRNYSKGVKAVFDKESRKGSCELGTLVLAGSESITPAVENGDVLAVEATEWLVNNKYMETQRQVVSKGTLMFIDANTPPGKFAIECASTGEGPLGPGSVRELTSLTMTGCKQTSEKPVCESVTVEAKNLPWRTGLLTSEGATRELIFEGGKGAPKFVVKCKTIIGMETDECSGNTSAAIKAITGGVDETFDSHSEKLNCAIGGAGQGRIEGTSLLENPGGETLSFQT